MRLPALGAMGTRKLVHGVLVLAGLVWLTIPAWVEAQSRRFCARCQKHQCCCPQQMVQPQPVTVPVVVPQTSYQPVIETQYVQQPVLTYRDQVQTEYRTEPVAETVPVTTYETVQVDEGSYQTVWVPRVVAKQVPKTIYQTRTSYRSTPYQVTRRVPDYTTQTVPTQTVRYMPTTSTGIAYAPLYPQAQTAYAPLGTTYPYTTAYVNPYPYSSYPAVGSIYSPASAPIVASVPLGSWTPTALAPSSVSSPSTASSTGGSLVPQPDNRFATSSSPTPIMPRAAYREDSSSSGAGPELRQADRSPMFVPAPSAAAVWRTPRGTETR